MCDRILALIVIGVGLVLIICGMIVLEKRFREKSNQAVVIQGNEIYSHGGYLIILPEGSKVTGQSYVGANNDADEQDLVSTIAAHWNYGPWATEADIEVIRMSALDILANGHSTIINADIEGSVTMRGRNGYIGNSTFRGR